VPGRRRSRAYSDAVDSPVGREREQEAVATFLAAAASGTAVLAVDGEAGIGKTTLCRYAVRLAREAGTTVLEARPGEAERGMSFAVLTDLLAGLPDEAFDALPGPQREPLLVASLRGTPTSTAPDPRAIGTGLAALLAARLAAGPALLLVDDEQWVDPPSHAALTFALRRLGAGTVPLGLLVARRGEAGGDLRGALVDPAWRRSLTLRGLSAGALFHVLKRELGETLSRPALMRVTEASGGNPYFAVELARASLHESGGAPLRVPDSLQAVTAARLARLSDAGRDAAVAVAASNRPTPELLAALGMTAGLDEAERAGVVRLAAGRVLFSHPLLASAALDLIPAARLRALHRRLADQVADPEARARHSALATPGVDAAVAAALDVAGRSAELRGAATGATDLARLALERTPPGDATGLWSRRVRLAELLHVGGATTEAAALLADLDGCPAGALRARGWLVRTEIAYQTASTAAAESCAGRALADAEAAPDAALAVRALLSLAALGTDGEACADLVARAREYVERGAVADPVLEGWALCEDVAARFHLGRGLDLPALDRALALERTGRTWSSNDQVAATRPVLLRWADHPDGAAAALAELHARAEAEGNETIVTYAVGHLSGVALRRGDAVLAAALAADHLRHATGAGQDSQRMQALANTAVVALYTGRPEEAEDAARQIAAWGEDAGDRWADMSSAAVLGTTALWRGDAATACTWFARWQAACAAAGVVDPGISRYHGEQIEALLLAGDAPAARAATERLTAVARAAGRHSALAVAARCEALLAAAEGRLEDAAGHLDAALAEHDLAPVPVERARTLLLLGQVRRRAKARNEAGEAFERSAALFAGAGATDWQARAAAELARLRERSTGDLTTTEHLVAELAASGLTNRQVSEQAFMSPKTVEAHLARVYRKLGISSRAELGARMRA
jgi:DNA-binding CsgD family transcriptional regulator